MTPSQRTAFSAIGIPTDVLHQCYGNFLPGVDAEARRDPEYSPLYADLGGLPPALFTVGTLDPLLDDSLFMAARWKAAGNRAELAVYPESIHGFVGFPTELGKRAKTRIEDFLASCLS
jgi:acetyl esterase/lipase